MGVYFHNYVSLYSFVMGVVWFNAFIILGLLMRKLKHPIAFSVIPLSLLLILSVLRMFIMVEVPGTVVVWSESLYPAIVNFFRLELVPYELFGLPVSIANAFVFIWIAGIVWFAVRYADRYIGKFPGLMQWYVAMPRDKRAESLLSEIIDNNRHFRVYRSGAFTSPVATAFSPYIILPEVEFLDDELRVILLHEWKHIQDRDYLADIVINIICFVFWWNPVVYIMKRNFKFATELKCDGYAAPNKEDFHHLLDGLVKLDNAEKEKARSLMNFEGVNALVSREDELVDRLTVMAMRWKSGSKRRMLTNAFYSIVVVALFFASYSFTILPTSWQSQYATVTAEDFMGEYRQAGDVFHGDEHILVENGGGTFSYYINGVFVMHVDADSNLLNWVEVRARKIE